MSEKPQVGDMAFTRYVASDWLVKSFIKNIIKTCLECDVLIYSSNLKWWTTTSIKLSVDRMADSKDIQGHLEKVAQRKKTREKLVFDPTTGKLTVVPPNVKLNPDNVVTTDMAAAGFFLLKNCINTVCCYVDMPLYSNPFTYFHVHLNFHCLSITMPARS